MWPSGTRIRRRPARTTRCRPCSGRTPSRSSRRALVHNLEHGGVFIQYGEDVPEATVRQLQAFYADHDRGTLLSPLPRLGKQIALGAWVTPSDDKPDEGKGYLMKCTRFDEAAFAAFLEEFQYKGPERFPADSLLPGH